MWTLVGIKPYFWNGGEHFTNLDNSEAKRPHC